MPKINTALANAMQDFETRKAFGRIELDYRRGDVVMVRKQETISTQEENSSGTFKETNRR